MKKNKIAIIVSLFIAIASFIVSFKILPQYINNGSCESEITIEILSEKDKLAGGHEMLLYKNASINGASTPINATKIEGNFNTDGGYFWGLSPGSTITISFPAVQSFFINRLLNLL